MTSDSASIKDTIDEVEGPFLSSKDGKTGSVRDRMKTNEDIVYTRYDYPSELSPLLAQKIGVGAATARSYLLQLKGALQSDITLHLDPVGELVRQETAADKVEVLEAYTLMRLDPLGHVRDAMHHFQSMGLFFAAWLEIEEYEPTVQGKDESSSEWAKRSKSDRASWFPWKLSVLNPATVAFTEQYKVVTLGTRRFRLPIIDLMTRYQANYKVEKGDDERALTLFNEHYGWLRAGDEQDWHSPRDLWRKDAEVCVVDNGTTISHYVDLGVGRDGSVKPVAQGAQRYRGAGEVDFDNPFGQCSLLLAEGVYNPYQPLSHRREGLLQPLISILHSEARLKSHWVSRSASPPIIQDVPPPEVGLWLAQNPNEVARATGLTLQIDEMGNAVALRPLGELKELQLSVEAPLDKLQAIWEREEGIASPRGLILTEEAAGSTASVVLGQLDEKNQALGPTQKSEINLWSTVLDMVMYSRKHHRNQHRNRGDKAQEADWGAAFTTTGQEWKIKGRVVKRGEKMEITPQDEDVEFSRTLTPIDNRLSTRAARVEQASVMRATGRMTWNEYLEESGIENVTEFNETIVEENLFQGRVPAIIMDQQIKVAEMTALLTGEPMADVLAKMGALANLAPMTEKAINPGAPSGDGFQMKSPQLEPIGAASSTTSVTA